MNLRTGEVFKLSLRGWEVGRSFPSGHRQGEQRLLIIRDGRVMQAGVETGLAVAFN